MGGVNRKRRLGLGLAIVAAGLVAVGVCALAFGASGPASSGAGEIRISLTVKSQAEPGSRVAAVGRVVGDAAGARVQLQAHGTAGWGALARPALRKGRFAVSFSMPEGRDLEVRAVLAAGKRTIAVSPTRHIALIAPSAVGVGTGAGGPPAVSATPPSSTSAELPPATEAPGGEPPPATNAYWGAWIGSQFTGEEAPWDMNAVTDFEAEAGKAPSLIEFSSPFADCSQSPCSYYSFPLTPFEDIRARGAIPFFSWSSQSLPSTVEEPEYQLADIAAGDYDPYIKEFAEAAAAWGHPFFLRFDWEMNGTWFPWGATVNGNTPADYVAAWRHVHHVFEQAGATNASWVWCPYVDPNSTLTDMASLYPGDEYVDWTCLDGYNWGPSAKPARKWKTFSSLFATSYQQITESIAATKPLLVGETASSEVGGSKEEWIAQAFAALPVEFPRIQGLIWFDKYDDGMDWPLETSPGAESAFAAGIADPRYLANSFGGLDSSPIPPP
jgi:hypothetical protein